MTTMSFQNAHDYLRRCVGGPTDDDGHDLWATQAETVILDHQPRDHAEAAIMIDTLLNNLAAGARTDGRDLSALAHLKAWLSSRAKDAMAA